MRIRTQVRNFANNCSTWLRAADGTEIIEFAVSMPLLMVMAVGIYDFGSAFTLKHKLNSAVREGARIASIQHHPANPAANEGCGTPASICVIRDVIANDLQASTGSDCDLGTEGGTYAGGSTFTWTFSGSCSGFSLKIERAVLSSAALANPFEDGVPYRIENTKVTLVYPYQWKFNQAFKLLDRNANYLRSTITVFATMQNMD